MSEDQPMRFQRALFILFACVITDVFAGGSVGCSHNNFTDDTTNDAGAKKDAGPVSEPPHAEGDSFLGEAHGTNGGTAAPIVSVSFIPDSTQITSCAQTMGDCKITKAPKCTTTCNVGEYCTFDQSCNSVCKRACSKTCAIDEECYFPSDGADPQCRKRESFDSGAIAFAGTTVPITLYPPYKYSGPSTGAPFLAGADITVQGSGAQAAGFTMWQESIKSTTFLQTQLGKLTNAQVYSTDPLPIDWAPGNDQIMITLSGAGGSAVCQANDPSGHYAVDRDVVTAALGSASTLSISVSRQRLDVKKGISTKGTLSSAKIQSEGWVKNTTSSTESQSFQVCQGGLAMCGGKCTDTMNDSLNCGTCNNACSNMGCVQGMCSGMSCNSCVTNAQNGTCKSYFDACNQNAACSSLSNCIANCNGNQTCINNCANTYSAGLTLYNNRRNCICTTACFTPCKVECGN